MHRGKCFGNPFSVHIWSSGNPTLGTLQQGDKGKEREGRRERKKFFDVGLTGKDLEKKFRIRLISRTEVTIQNKKSV
jgi:hypothetical protein